MKEINLDNKEILSTLSDISKILEDTNALNEMIFYKSQKNYDLINYQGIEDQYLYEAMKDFKKFGYPRSTNLLGIEDSSLFRKFIQPKTKKLQRRLGAKANSLAVIYPPDGYIGWHHNGNAPGYNVLFTYSIDGEGYFKYYDYEKKEIVKIKDKQGWSAKVGYFPSEEFEPSRVFWHEAETKNYRISVAFIIPDKNLWENMISYITNGNYNKKEIESQGPIKQQ